MAKKIVEETVKPTNDAYTGMLAISLIALLIGGALLYLDMNQYDWKKDPPKQPTISPPPKMEAAKEKEKVDPPKDKEADKKDAEKKDPEKKDPEKKE